MRYKKSVFRSLAMVTQLGLCVLTPTILGIAAGSFLDARFGTKVTLILLVLGVLVAEGYCPALKGGKLKEGKPVNFQAALDNGVITVGTPLIFGGF